MILYLGGDGSEILSRQFYVSSLRNTIHKVCLSSNSGQVEFPACHCLLPLATCPEHFDTNNNPDRSADLLRTTRQTKIVRLSGDEPESIIVTYEPSLFENKEKNNQRWWGFFFCRSNGIAKLLENIHMWGEDEWMHKSCLTELNLNHPRLARSASVCFLTRTEKADQSKCTFLNKGATRCTVRNHRARLCRGGIHHQYISYGIK